MNVLRVFRAALLALGLGLAVAGPAGAADAPAQPVAKFDFDHPTFANAAWLVPGARGLLLPAESFSGSSRESRLAQPGNS